MIVDDWTEVCRENTDIEAMHKEFGLVEADVRTMADVLSAGHEPMGTEKVVMFNPMGMAVFDIAVGSYFLNRAIDQGVGTDLDD
jgi:ornithine cyclodeaminase